MLAILFDKIHSSIQHYFSLFLDVLQGSRADSVVVTASNKLGLYPDSIPFFKSPKSRAQRNKEDCQKCWAWAKFIFPLSLLELRFYFFYSMKSQYILNISYNILQSLEWQLILSRCFLWTTAVRRFNRSLWPST